MKATLPFPSLSSVQRYFSLYEYRRLGKHSVIAGIEMMQIKRKIFLVKGRENVWNLGTWKAQLEAAGSVPPSPRCRNRCLGGFWSKKLLARNETRCMFSLNRESDSQLVFRNSFDTWKVRYRKAGTVPPWSSIPIGMDGHLRKHSRVAGMYLHSAKRMKK